MKKTILTSIACLVLGTATAFSQTTLVAGWDFQTTTTGGTAAAAAPGAPLSYISNFGSGTLFLDGSFGSSIWTSLASSPEVTSFGGSSVNTAGTDFSTVTTGTSSLALANSSANGKSAVFAFSMTGLSDLSISYSTQRSATGFTSQTWEYSTNGTLWTLFDTQTWPGGTGSATTFNGVGVVSLNTVTALDDVSTAYARVTFDGATASAGNNRLDNLQLNAIPEPSVVILFGIGLAFVLWRMRATRRQTV